MGRPVKSASRDYSIRTGSALRAATTGIGKVSILALSVATIARNAPICKNARNVRQAGYTLACASQHAQMELFWAMASAMHARKTVPNAKTANHASNVLTVLR
jgi:hypothetical protein